MSPHQQLLLLWPPAQGLRIGLHRLGFTQRHPVSGVSTAPPPEKISNLCQATSSGRLLPLVLICPNVLVEAPLRLTSLCLLFSVGTRWQDLVLVDALPLSRECHGAAPFCQSSPRAPWDEQ